MSQYELGKWLSRYFQQTSKLDSSNLEKLNQLLDRFANQGCQLKPIQLLFETMQNAITKDNLKLIVKRYLYLMNVILQRDQNIPFHNKYQNAVSQQIVEHFIIILKHLLKYSMIDEILLAKIFRKKWAKRITDSAFQKINAEAMKKLNNFNLDRGFNDQHIEKITKGYQKRGFSQADIEKYLSIQQRPRSESPKTQQPVHSQSSEEQQSESPRKRVKMQRFPSNDRGSTNMMNSHSYIPSISFPTHQTYSVHNSNNNFYPPYIYPDQRGYPPPPPMYFPDYQPNNPRYYNPPPPIYHQQILTPTQTQTSSPYQVSNYSKTEQIRKQKPDPHLKIRQIYRKLKFAQLYECKSCGLNLSTQQTFNKHNFQHFQESQKNFQTTHSRRDPNILRQTYLPQIQEWVNNSRKIKQNQIKHYVPIQQINKKSINILGNSSKILQKCSICKGNLKILWSDQMDIWVYEDTIRVSFDGHNQGVTHFQCYQTIQDILVKENSSPV